VYIVGDLNVSLDRDDDINTKQLLDLLIIIIIIMIIRNLYSAIMPLGGYRAAGVLVLVNNLQSSEVIRRW